MIRPEADSARAELSRYRRHFVEELAACVVVRDHTGQKFARVDFEDQLDLRLAAKLPTKAEARQIAANIAKLPGLVSKTADPKTVKSSWW